MSTGFFRNYVSNKGDLTLELLDSLSDVNLTLIYLGTKYFRLCFHVHYAACVCVCVCKIPHATDTLSAMLKDKEHYLL